MDVSTSDISPEIRVERRGVLLVPNGDPEEIEGVLNPGVTLDRDGRLVLYPRMVARGNVSRIGMARAVSGHERPVFDRLGFALEPKARYEHRDAAGGHGCEDARVTFVPLLDRYVMSYTAFGPDGARIALAHSADAYHWERLGLVDFPTEVLNRCDNKDAAFFPEPVKSPSGVESFAFYHRPMLPTTINGQTPISIILALPPAQREAMCLAYVPVARALQNVSELCFPTESARVLDVGLDWGVLKNGAGTPPVRSPHGWLAFFHAVDPVERNGRLGLSYRAGLVIHDFERPDRVLYRSERPLMQPETEAERFGTVDDVVFPSGMCVLANGIYDVFYGAADAKISLARVRISYANAKAADRFNAFGSPLK